MSRYTAVISKYLGTLALAVGLIASAPSYATDWQRNDDWQRRALKIQFPTADPGVATPGTQLAQAQRAAATQVDDATAAAPDENVQALAAEIAKIISAGQGGGTDVATDAQTNANAAALADAIAGYVKAANAQKQPAAAQSGDTISAAAGQVQARSSQQPDNTVKSQVAQQQPEALPPPPGAGDDATGTDPRGFGPKLMPYYRHTELRNDLEVDEAVLFGMIKLDDPGRVAMTYEMPIAKKIDYSRVSGFQQLGLPANTGGGASGFPSGGVAANGLEADGDTVGIGDLNLRFLFKPSALEWKSNMFSGTFPDGAKHSIMALFETTFPTASEDVLGSQSLILSPGFAYVQDLKLLSPGFVAAMNFFDIEAWHDDSVDGTARYRGRWFLMQPLTRPGPGLTSGLYLLPEFQPAYDFNEKHFSFWVGPELGKIFAPGRIGYVKPGFGVDPDDGDREWTFELGVRWFL